MSDHSDTDSADQTEELVVEFDSKETITFGRDENNDVELTDDWISPHHAEIRRRDAYQLVDLENTTGIHHEGRRVAGKTVIKVNDVFSIGRHDFVLREKGIYRYHAAPTPTLIEAYDLTVQVPDRARGRFPRGRPVPLIDDVSFVVRRGTLLGVVGPSGSGKSTLLKAITGSQPATQGKLVFDNEDLAEHSGPHRGIGMVPQEDIMHTALSVRRALRFAAALRCPREWTRAQRDWRVDEVIALLDLNEQHRQRIDNLSGGQCKRASVALELLTTPPLLCLDEPTSGLDPSLDREVMGALRDLTKEAKTVIVTTHNPLHLGACDYVLVMCKGGRMAYFGPPGPGLFEFFGKGQNYADVFSKITNDPEVWAQEYRNSDTYRQYVGNEQLRLLQRQSQERSQSVAAHADGVATAEPGTSGSSASTTSTAPPQRAARSARSTTAAPDDRQVRQPDRPAGQPVQRPPTPARQLVTLCLRMASLIWSDRRYALLLLGVPLALAGLSHLIPGNKGLAPDAAGFSLEANRLLIVLITGAAFMGIAVPIREIINEAEIYRRERAVGLSPTAYLLSKVVMFAIIDCIQVVVFVSLTLLGRGRPREALVLHDATVEIMVAVALVAIASTALGLLVSALVRTVEQTTPVFVVSVMAQLILSGALFQIAGQKALEVAAWLDPSRWGYAAAAATTNLQNFPFADPLWNHDATIWRGSVAFLSIQIVALLALTRWALTRYEPGRG